MEDRWKWILVASIAPVAWGSNYYVTRQFLPSHDPLWGGALRALPAGLLLLLLARRLPSGQWWWKAPILGALNVGAFFVLVYIASQLLPSSVASTIMATSAGVLMLLAWPVLSERPSLFAVAGTLIGLAGVCLLLVRDDTSVAPWGVVASLGAMLMSSTGFVLTKRWAPRESMIAITSWQLISGGLLVLPFAVALEGTPPALDPAASFALAYVTVVATAVAYVAWFTGLQHLPAGTVGLVGLLNPVTGVAFGTILAGELFGPRQAAGTLLVLLGVFLGQRRRSARTRPHPKARLLADELQRPSASGPQ